MHTDSLDLADQPKLDSEFTKGRFNGKVAVVCGGAGGIGSSISARFLNDGVSGLAIVDMNEAAARKLLDDHFREHAQAGRVAHFAADLASRKACFDVVESIVAKFGRIDFLVNGIAYFKTSGLTSTESEWATAMNVNAASYAFMAQACFGRMEASSGCAIVNINSCSGHRAQPDRWTYCASKGAVGMLTKCMALDMATAGIRVNAVSPAWIWSPEVAKIAKDFPNRAEFESSSAGAFHMVGRTGDMAEVAAAVAFLCSRDASFINGTDLRVDGGYCAMGPEQLGQNSHLDYQK